MDRNGNYSEEPTNTCEKYVVGQDKWIDIASMPTPCFNSAACDFNDRYIYKFGGKQNHRELLRSIHRYDSMYDKWEEIGLRISHGENYSKFQMGCIAACL